MPTKEGFRGSCLFAVAAGLLVFAGLAKAQTPLRVGEPHKIHLESSGLIERAGVATIESAPTGTGRTFEIQHPGATYISLHFKNFNLQPEESLIISDPAGGQSYTMEGRGRSDLGTFWAQHVKGDTIVLDLVTTRNGAPGFLIDEYAAGFVDLGAGIERICGNNDLENAVCALDGRTGGSAAYNKGRAVARLLIQGISLCTGWLASADNRLFTNQHCISTNAAAVNTDYEFAAEAPTCGSANCQLCWPGAIFSGQSLLKASSTYDYALIKLNGNPAGTYGFIEIDDRDAIVGETIYIPAHSAGRAKEFGFNCNPNGPGPVGGRCVVSSITEAGCSSTSYNDVGYWVDGEGGSSGSPVVAASNDKAVALHHCHNFCDEGSNQENRAVPIDLVCTDACNFIACKPCGPNDGCCGPGCTFAADPNCCRPAGTSCTSNSQCCAPLKCKGNPKKCN